MTIYLRRELVERLIDDRYENIDGLVDAWALRVDADANYPPCRERATIYHWLKNGLPTPNGRGRHLIFALCGLLDADPMALLDYKKSRYFKDFTQLRMSLYTLTNRVFGSGVSNFAPLIDMFMPGPSWPNVAMADIFYRREWFGYEFNNRGHEGSDDYGLIKVKFRIPQPHHVKSAHIAYRRTDTIDKMWRYYGVVNIIGDQLELYTEGGYHNSMNCRAKGQIWFRTSFGHRPVEFRLVSIHDFDYSSEINNDMSIIGFNW